MEVIFFVILRNCFAHPYTNVAEFLAEAIYLSVDPYMRAFAPAENIGKPVSGEQVAK